MSVNQNLNEGKNSNEGNRIITPRFYTTNFNKLFFFNTKYNNVELKVAIGELECDYNKQKFLRHSILSRTSQNLNAITKKKFIHFLRRSCLAEFSGFLLYKEIARFLKDKNSLLANAFIYMSRDEARHAAFLNQILADFDASFNFSLLNKTRKRIFFPPDFLYYSTYLSEKIGYWRYITIYRHLEKNSALCFHPLFKFFESWCQDENRHAYFLGTLLKSNKKLLNTLIAKFWCKVFLLLVYLTMYINDSQDQAFYASLGLNWKDFDRYIIYKTNQSVQTVFPIILNVKHPKFFVLLDECSKIYSKFIQLNTDAIPKEQKIVTQGICCVKFFLNFIQLHFIPSLLTDFNKKL